MESTWLTTAQAAAALGVKPSTVYAYVSRGVVTRHVDVVEGRRVSRFLREEILALAAERARPRAGVLSALIESDITTLETEGKLAFRGVDIETCAQWGFEKTAAHVLGDVHPAWPAPARLSMPEFKRTTDTIRAVILHLADGDPDRTSLSPDHCRHVALTSIETATFALCSTTTGSVAERLAHLWSQKTHSSDAVASAVDVALAILVDHELTASTLAARAAAGVRADPWMVLLTGLSAMSGGWQAGASRLAHRVLEDWLAGHTPAGNHVPGFGHAIYLGPDPRAELLLTAVADLEPSLGAAVDALALHMVRTRGSHPNIDLALAALTMAGRFPPEAGEVLFTLARIPGLVAHALEEYPHSLRLRPRALG